MDPNSNEWIYRERKGRSIAQRHREGEAIY